MLPTQSLTIALPDGASLDVEVEPSVMAWKGQNAPKVKTVVWDVPGYTVTAYLHATYVPAPSGPPTISLPAGFAPIANFTTPRAPYTWTPLDRSDDGMAVTEYMASQVAETATGWELTAALGGPLGYVSGYISSGGTFEAPCRVDFEVALPEGQGLWPACWLVASGQGEIDVMECLAGNPSVVYATCHAANGGGWTQQGTRKVGGSNVFSLVWEPGLVTMACDYAAFAQFTPTTFAANTGQPWPFDTAQLPAICNLAVGGPDEWGGAPNASTAFPAVMGVQSVAAWT